MNGLGDRLSLLEARLGLLERLDARRREAPGQLGLDLAGGAPAADKGPGGGEKCGAGWIDPKKTCRKGEGGAPIDPSGAPPDRPYEAKRSKPKETIVFPEPIVGPTGAKLTAYTWQWTLTEDVDHRGEPVEKRVSDWEKSIANVETGRNVVHQFQVEVGGETRTVSAESALKLMGFLNDNDRKAFGSLKSSARTVARLRMAQQEVEQRARRLETDWSEVSHLPQPETKIGQWKPDPKDPAIQWRNWQMGETREQEMQSARRGRGFTDEEMQARVRGAWLNQQMLARGWGGGKGWWHASTERNMLDRQRDDLAKRLVRAEAKLMAQTRPGATGRIDSRMIRLDVLDAMLRVKTRNDTAMAQPGGKRAEEAQEAIAEIDWANVASEAAAMVELNKGATASWQGQQPEEEDS